MKLQTLVIAAALSGILTIGCNEPKTGTQTQTEIEPTETSKLELTYVSGHLGSYFDCPQKGASSGKADEAEPGFAAGACEDGDDDCGGPLNCEDGSLLIQVANVGAADAVDITITDLELLSATLAPMTTLEVLGMEKGGAAFNGRLGKGETVQVRVRFQGPAATDWQGIEAALHIIMVTGDNQDAELTTPTLQSLPMVAT